MNRKQKEREQRDALPVKDAIDPKTGRVTLYYFVEKKIKEVQPVDAKDAIARGFATFDLSLANQAQDFASRTVKELKEAASEADIEGYANMNKAELVAALEAESAEDDEEVPGNQEEEDD